MSDKDGGELSAKHTKTPLLSQNNYLTLFVCDAITKNRQHKREHKMRSYRVYGIRDGGAEQYVDTVHSPAEGKQIHQMMKIQGYFDVMVVRDALGGKQIERNLRTGEKVL